MGAGVFIINTSRHHTSVVSSTPSVRKRVAVPGRITGSPSFCGHSARDFESEHISCC